MPLFDVRHKLKIHILQIILIHIIIGVTAPRLFMKGQPRTRANTIALGMVKSPIACLREDSQPWQY